MPAPNANFVAIAGGADQSVGIRSDPRTRFVDFARFQNYFDPALLTEQWHPCRLFDVNGDSFIDLADYAALHELMSGP